MAELLKVFKAITEISDSSWGEISDMDKIECFFVINRNFSKIYPNKSLNLNDKEIDKIAAMNLWRSFMKSQPYPSDFWSKSPTSSAKLSPGEYAENDIIMLLEKLEITMDEFNLLYNKHRVELDEELKYYKKLQKQ
jgi:hypothetical protein